MTSTNLLNNTSLINVFTEPLLENMPDASGLSILNSNYYLQRYFNSNLCGLILSYLSQCKNHNSSTQYEECYICSDFYCKRCMNVCDVCDTLLCNFCSMKCKGCEKNCCDECMIECVVCERKYHKKCQTNIFDQLRIYLVSDIAEIVIEYLNENKVDNLYIIYDIGMICCLFN